MNGNKKELGVAICITLGGILLALGPRLHIGKPAPWAIPAGCVIAVIGLLLLVLAIKANGANNPNAETWPTDEGSLPEDSFGDEDEDGDEQSLLDAINAAQSFEDLLEILRENYSGDFSDEEDAAFKAKADGMQLTRADWQKILDEVDGEGSAIEQFAQDRVDAD